MTMKATSIHVTNELCINCPCVEVKIIKSTLCRGADDEIVPM